MARVKVLQEAIMLCGKAKITPFVWGHRGLGKSSIVRELAAHNNMGFVDFRCSQVEASDLRGLPDRVDGRTVFLPPADMPRGDLPYNQILGIILAPFQKGGLYPLNFTSSDPQKQHAELLDTINTDIHAHRVYVQNQKTIQPRFERGIIFLDELNRAQDDVQQAAFQFVLDREIGQYVLPPEWIVVVAGNYNEGYQVSGFTDPAFLDRFCHLTFSAGESTLEDWIYYMTSAHGGNAAAVIEFASQNMKHLDGELEGELGFNIMPSRRSWEGVVRVEEVCSNGGFTNDALHEVISGLVGRELALTYQRYNCPVKPRDLLKNGVSKHVSVMNGLNRGQLTGLMWGLVSCVLENIDKDEVANVCLDFAEFMVQHKDKDLAVAFCRSMVTSGASSGQEKAAAALVSNPRLAKMVGKFNIRQGNRKSFIDRVNDRPKLQSVLASVAWGSNSSGSDE